MKIAMMVGVFPALSKTAVLNQITGLIDRGHQVDIIVVGKKKDDNSFLHDDIKKYKLLRPFRRFQKAPARKSILILKFLSRWTMNFYKDPVKAFGYLNIFQFEKARRNIQIGYYELPLLGQEPYDIVHFQFGSIAVNNIKFMNFAVFKHAKLIVSFRGGDITKFINNHGEDIYSNVFNDADIFLPVCNYFKELLINLGCEENKIIVHYSGIKCNRFRFKSRIPINGQSIHILSVGRLVEKKGLKYSILAVSKLLKSGHNIKYSIVGGGPLREDLLKLILDLNVSDKIKLLGVKIQNEVVDILDNSHIFIAPSITSEDKNQEGIPNVLKEAMAMGLPVVSTYHSGIPELVHDGISGYLLQEKNIDNLADKIQYLINHTDLWADLGKSGRKYVIEHFDIDKLNDELVNIYEYNSANLGVVSSQ